MSPIITQLYSLRTRILQGLLTAGLALFLSTSTVSLAAGLGKATLHSVIGQVLTVDIDVTVGPGEVIHERCFRITPPLAEEDISNSITSANLRLDRKDGKYQLHVVSKHSVYEPVAILTVRMDCGNPLIRQYTFLPDLPATEEPKQVTLSNESAQSRQENTRTAPAESATPTQVEPKNERRSRKKRPDAEEATAPAKEALRETQEKPTAKPPALPPQQAKSEIKRRSSNDRVSLGMLDPTLLQLIEAPMQLQMSNTLNLGNVLPAAERAAQVNSLMEIERRLTDRAKDISYANYDPKQRLEELQKLLAEVKTLSAQMPETVNLPVTATSAPTQELTPKSVPADTSAIPERERSKPAAVSVEGSDSYLIETLLILAIIASIVAYLVFTHKNKTAKHRPETYPPTPEHPLFNEDSRSAEAAPNLNIFRAPDTEKAAETNHGTPSPNVLRDPQNDISVSHSLEDEIDDELTACIEAAEIMICFGRYAAAAAEIENFIAEQPQTGLRARLALLNVYRRGKMQSAFDTLSLDLRQKFNIELQPSNLDEPVNTYPGLEKFPHIIERLCELWDSTECLSYVKTLITDTRDGTRIGFNLETAEELALLESILQSYTDQGILNSSISAEQAAFTAVASPAIDTESRLLNSSLVETIPPLVFEFTPDISLDLPSDKPKPLEIISPLLELDPPPESEKNTVRKH